MFGLFRKKEKGVKVIDLVWISTDAKFKYCLTLVKEEPNVELVAWFEDTRNILREYFKSNNQEVQLYLADALQMGQSDKTYIFVEHHPLRAEEDKIAIELGLEEMKVLSALSEPIFQLFGVEKVVALMHKMGVQEDEVISSPMISSAIKNAQEKVASKTMVIGSLRSQADWILSAGLKP